MFYLRGAIVLAFGQVTLMHYVRAVVIALAVAITFPQMAYAQTNAIHVILSPVGGTTPATPAAICTTGSCQKLVPRYPKSPTYMLGILEYNTTTCVENTPGKWGGFPSTTSNKGEISTGFASGPPPPCTTSGTWTYAVIYFNWTAHNNQSTPSPSLVDGYPMDQFPATWTDDNTDGFTKSCFCQGPYPYTFNPYVLVVRPKGEKGSVVNWYDSRANWEQTLIPPDNDSTFSFASEKVKEALLSSNPVTGDRSSNSCAAVAPHALDGTPNGSAAKEPWIVDQDNKWGDDTVGFGACAVEAYRCAGATPCTYSVPQQMYIKSPADSDFTYVYSNNILGAGIGIPIPTSITETGRKLDLKQFFGFVSSKRFTPLGGGKESTGFTSVKANCASYINLSKCPPY